MQNASVVCSDRRADSGTERSCDPFSISFPFGAIATFATYESSTERQLDIRILPESFQAEPAETIPPENSARLDSKSDRNVRCFSHR